MDDKLGENIKKLRTNKKMTLKDVSDKSGLSISFLSQVERSISSVTMTSLKKISMALGVNVSYFFQTPTGGKVNIKRKNDKIQTNFENANFYFSNLTGGVTNPTFEPIKATLLPGETERKPYSHNGQEFIYILNGVLTVRLDESEYELTEGDSLHIDSSTPHTWFNNSLKPVELLIITTTGNASYFL